MSLVQTKSPKANGKGLPRIYHGRALLLALPSEESKKIERSFRVKVPLAADRPHIIPRRCIAAAALAFAVSIGGQSSARTLIQAPIAAGAANAEPQLFTTEESARTHCPRDEVVWLNLNSGIYHEKGMRWYGNTKHGAYVCRKEADAAGDRDTRNGQ
jgi:hypothetical protein